MQGQIWQECDICGEEPVCSACLKCKKHCDCSKTKLKFQSFEEFNKITKFFDPVGDF